MKPLQDSGGGQPTPTVSVPRQASVPSTDPLPETASLLLDILRFGLCLLVLLGHISEGWFNTNWPNMMMLANGAVPGFFVLSGFVIRYVTRTRERQGRRYFASRASRIYSVVLPAIVLTVVLDSIVLHVNPVFYRYILLPTPWSQLPPRILVNLLFLSQSWGHAALMLSDTPLWSLGYEVPYYILFGIATFSRGPARLVGLLIVAALTGPQVLLLLPIWVSGIWLYDLWQWFRAPHTAFSKRLALLTAAAAALLFLWLPVSSTTGFARVSRVPNPLLLLHQPIVRATMFEYSAGLLSFAAMLLALCASDLVQLPKKTKAARAVRFVAESTFTLYLFHFPMLVFAAALHLFSSNSSVGKLLTMLAIVAVCVAASVPIERFKRWLRDRISLRNATSHPAK